MPELAEVETIRRTLEKTILGKKIEDIKVFRRDLRWPIPADFEEAITNKKIIGVSRRSKYLILELEKAFAIFHFGMSGSLRISDEKEDLKKHDHIQISLREKKEKTTLRFHDPRRFGSVDWVTKIQTHPRIAKLGPEPLSNDWNTEYFLNKCRSRKASIKNILLNGQIVAGVGNIYANEALFMSNIHPLKQACSISKKEASKVVSSIKTVLSKAIEHGGTTLKDYINPNGEKGEFKKELFVYDRSGEKCRKCNVKIETIRQGQRASYFCSKCQKI